MSATISFVGLREAERMVDEFSDKELANKMRRAVRAGLKPFQEQLKFEGDTPGHPHSFTKVPAGKVSTRGGASGREIYGYVRPKSPLFNIFEPGAKAHTITPKQAVLAGPAGSGSWTAEGRKRSGAFFSTKPVRHPGMAARPMLPAAFAAGALAAEDAVANAIFGHSVGSVVGE